MRPLKFRLVKDNKIVATQELKPNGIIDCPIEWDTAYQFTGLLDNQGKEIYEGDIVEFDFDKSYEQEYPKKERRCVNFVSGAFAPIFMQEREFHNFDDRPLSFDNFEIIGNIYENPERLTQVR